MRAACLLTASLILIACAEQKAEPSAQKETLPPLTKEQESHIKYGDIDYSEIATQLVELNQDGLAIGEVHGQLGSIRLIDAVIKEAKKTYPEVIVLQEMTLREAGLDESRHPESEFIPIDMTDLALPFWSDHKNNWDHRASWDHYDLFEQISKDETVGLYYLWDPRLNPPPNYLKGHGFAKRFKQAKDNSPNAFIVSLSGNNYTQRPMNYPLEVTNSLCRYADEKFDMHITCIAMNNFRPEKGENICKKGAEAKLVSGKELYEYWDYVVMRSDRCMPPSRWAYKTEYYGP